MRAITQAAVGAEAKAASGYDGLTDRSGMISLDLPAGTLNPVPGGVEDGSHHVTVAFLGDSLTEDDFDQACSRAQEAASRVPGPLKVSLSGVAAFPPKDGKKAVCVPASVPGGAGLRSDLSDLSASDFPDWVPHATTPMASEGDPLPAPYPKRTVEVSHLSVHRGSDVWHFPFGGSVKETDMDDLEAKVGPKGFIHGWIRVGAPGVGDSVHHPKHGKGTVTSATDKHVSVRFSSGAEHSFERSAPSAKHPGRASAVSAADHQAGVAKAKQVHAAEKARGGGNLHPLAKVGKATTSPSGTVHSNAVDHEGREFKLKSNGPKVTVKHGDRSMSSSEARNPTVKAREMAGKLVGSGAAPKAKEPDAGKPYAPGLSQSYVTGKGATEADVAELSRRYEIMHGRKPSAAQLAKIKRAKTAAPAKAAAAKSPVPEKTPGSLSAGHLRGEGATDADVAELARRYEVMHGKPPTAKQLAGIKRAKPAAAPAKPATGHAATAHAIADDARTERGLNGFQREEAAARLRSAAGHLNNGNHEEAAKDLDDATRAAGTPGGGVIKGSAAARSRDLAAKVRAEHGTAANPVGPSPAGNAKALSGEAAYAHVAEPKGKADRSAVSYYTNGANYRYNKPLRAGEKVTDKDDAKRLRAMDTAFANTAPTTQSLTVHRGLRGDLFGKVDATGTEFTDKGFTSASTDAEQAAEFTPENGGALMEIHVPAGSRVVKPGSAGNEVYQDEKELILNRGGKYKITKDEMINHPKYGRMRKLTATYLGSE